MSSSCKFLTEPDDSLKCIICLEVASDPKQHGDCGKLFCTKCLEKNGNKPCPNCRTENPQYFKDRRSLQEIRDLCVECDNVERGCDWKGTVWTLLEHVNNCGFTLVSCPNKCQVDHEDSQLIWKDLDVHLKTSCLSREYQCEQCGEKGTFASITEEHDSVCIKKVVSCPNTKCTLTMERGLTKKHVETDCMYIVVACKYVSYGCSMESTRVDMKEHEEDDKCHLRLALDNIVNLEDTICLLQNGTTSLKVTACLLENTTSSLEATTSVLKMNIYTLRREKSMTFNLPGFSEKKEDNLVFYSEPFYTSPGGYKMHIRVAPNGKGAGEGTHVSVCSHVLEGSYDDNLPWPFFGTVTVELLNQLADKHHHCMRLAISTNQHNVQVANSWSYHNFIPYTKLSHTQARNTQYLMKDTLYFRVAVKVDHHKPWLHCSYHTK